MNKKSMPGNLRQLRDQKKSTVIRDRKERRGVCQIGLAAQAEPINISTPKRTGKDIMEGKVINVFVKVPRGK